MKGIKASEDSRGQGSPQTRDVDVLLALAQYRYLSTLQIERLLYPSRRVANRRLAVLADHGLVHRFRRLAVPGHGSNEFIYYLSAAGAVEAAARLGQEHVAYPRPKDRTPAGMDHLLGIIQFWLALDLACQERKLEVFQFWPEWQSREETPRFSSAIADETPDLSDVSRRIRFRPDAVFILSRAGKRALFFLEVDWQTEAIRGGNSKAFADKFVAYASYRQHGGFRRYGEDFRGFRVLTTWTASARMHNARAAAAELGLRQMILFAPFVQITPEAILERIWLCPGRDGETEPVGLVDGPPEAQI